MKGFMEWVQTTYPKYRIKDLEDLRIDWLTVRVEQLLERVEKLEAQLTEKSNKEQKS